MGGWLVEASYITELWGSKGGTSDPAVEPVHLEIFRRLQAEGLSGRFYVSTGGNFDSQPSDSRPAWAHATEDFG